MPGNTDFTVFGALFILTAKLIEIAHDRFSVVKSLENKRPRVEGDQVKFRESCQY